MKKLCLLIIVNIGVFCTLIVVIEISGQIAYYLRHGKFIFQTSDYNSEDYQDHLQAFELHPYLVGRLKKNITINSVENSAKIKTTNRHTRWTGAPEDDRNLIRVAVLGGSTAFGTGVTDRVHFATLHSRHNERFTFCAFHPIFALE